MTPLPIIGAILGTLLALFGAFWLGVNAGEGTEKAGLGCSLIIAGLCIAIFCIRSLL